MNVDVVVIVNGDVVGDVVPPHEAPPGSPTRHSSDTIPTDPPDASCTLAPMASPYRGGAAATPDGAVENDGLVDDLVKQFADPYAFLRELIQNAIDAGSPAVEVRIAFDDGAGATRVAVRDDGEGMTREVVEDQLLVLFRSTKERDPSKIGKFGIGFSSVLAPGPRVVVITTARDGRRLIVHLRADLAYELFDGGPATRAGTTVELELPMRADEVEPFVRGSRAALERWCRHASVPIHLHAPGGDAPVRIDRPLDLEDAIVAVTATGDGGALHAVVGITAAGTPCAGFFNHGLMLHETAEDLAGRLAFKVQDARLGHTLSRDNVRRDGAFRRAVGFVRDLAERELPAAAARAIRAAAESGDRRAYRDLVDAIALARVDVSWRDWVFPLLAPVGDRRAIGAGELDRRRPWGGRARTRLTAALDGAGVPLVDLGAGASTWLADQVRAITGVELVDVERELTLVEPVALTPTDELLLRHLGELLDVAHRAPRGIVLAELAGESRELVVAGGRGDATLALGRTESDPWVLDRKRAHRNPLGLLRRPTLVLRANHPVVVATRRRAVDDPATAASLLARVLLVRIGALDPGGSAALLDETLARLGLGGPS